jgi:hypothetical protein
MKRPPTNTLKSSTYSKPTCSRTQVSCQISFTGNDIAAPARATDCAVQSGIVEDWDEDAMEDSSLKVPVLSLRPSCVFGADAESVWDKLHAKSLEECTYYYILLYFRHTTRINSTMNDIEQSARQASINNGVRGSCASSSLTPGSTVSCTRSNDPAVILQDLMIFIEQYLKNI